MGFFFKSKEEKLHVAARNDDVEAAREALEKGADMNWQDKARARRVAPAAPAASPLSARAPRAIMASH